jgi:hypothetical protein
VGGARDAVATWGPAGTASRGALNRLKSF